MQYIETPALIIDMAQVEKNIENDFREGLYAAPAY